jgi:hypothetical protein
MNRPNEKSNEALFINTGKTTLATLIDCDTDPNKIIITDMSWFANGEGVPNTKNIRRLEYDFSVGSDLYKLQEGSLNAPMLNVPKVIAVSLGFLWERKVTSITFINVPGVSLLNFCDSLPEPGSMMQWEKKDTDVIINAVKDFYSAVRH